MWRAGTILAIAGGVLSGCASSYQAPASPPTISNEKIVALPFDDAWDRLVDHVSESFFVIDNVAKESGLLTLSYSVDRPSRLIDCGHVTKPGNLAGGAWDGPYADYLATRGNARLGGKMNVLVKRVDGGSTKVRVTARYVFDLPATVQTAAEAWTFDTGGADTHNVINPLPGTEASRTCRPTGAAEAEILKAFE
jgi:hypothetical protein